ncbi:MAG: flavin-binding family monooxygenase [Chitinophagales bacterium]|nr:MAG: flavin-binding family monooxygenase [Chitinophagales bacterium]
MKEAIPVYDVVIIGAGLSGIGAAYHIQKQCKGKTFAILEARGSMGGTWDLFRYPGIRSDSDMYTLGFPFYPWKNPRAIADGPAILEYIKETARHFGIDSKILYHHRVTDASWSDEENLWTLTLAPHEQVQKQKMQCRFLFACTGYYDYASGYMPEYPGMEKFSGRIIHPQQWDTTLDYRDKDIVIIGSGATAVTLAPELARTAKKVTVLQRTPTYIISLPSRDPVAEFFRKVLPTRWHYAIIRWKNILISMAMYLASRRWPAAVKKLIQKGIRKELGPDYDLRHFDPPYNPWDQRLCVVPDSDMFAAIREGKVDMVTDHIDRFTEKGIQLRSGHTLEADIIISATGLKIQMLGGMTLHLNGQLCNPANLHCYRGVMFSDLPNFAIAVGYTNASWTLKCDLNCRFVARLLNYMDKKRYAVCVPRYDPSIPDEPLIDLTSGYVLRARNQLPRQGSRHPWKVYQNYICDLFTLRLSTMQDPYLQYRKGTTNTLKGTSTRECV